MTDPVYILIHPDGRAEWGANKATAEKAMGPYGVGRGWLTDASLGLRVSMSDCALIMPEEFAENPYAVAVLAHVAGCGPEQALQPSRGPVALWGFDPRNEWDSSRPLTEWERAVITEALAVAGCTVG
ncbi:hypothetical protein [Kitasatospora sp. MBT63]|uniref:hypothetical protein n=1 Tax=Kitasatospora sp. MBT63 TaxID=1444768 RepID=UPI00053B4620|nr:hypothetical protein [Kitasatospora sp. MBT63]